MLRQTEQTDCGAACLRMILGYHGRHVTLSELRTEIGVGRDGTSGLSLIRAAEAHGLVIDALRVLPHALEGLGEPAILHWESSHYVVLEKVGRNGAVIVDPSMGRRYLTLDEFAGSFTGAVFLLTPGASFERHELEEERWGRYWRILRRAPRETLRVLLSSLALQAIGLVIPVATALVIDKVIPSGRHDLTSLVLAGALVFGLVHVAVAYLRSRALLRLQRLLDREMTTGFVSHLLSLPFVFFQSRTIGSVFAFLNSIVAVRDVLSSQFISMALDTVMVGGYFVLLLRYRPSFAAVALGVGLLQALTVFVAKRSMHRATQDQVLSQSRAQGLLIEMLRGIETIKSGGVELKVFEKWQKLHAVQVDAAFARDMIGERVRVSMASLAALSPIVLLAVGAESVVEGQLKVGAMLALIALAVGFLAPLTSLLGSLNRAQVVGAHLDRLADAYEQVPERVGGTDADGLGGKIEFEDVSFRYAPDSPRVLKNVSFVIERNSTVALVGPSGSGKSTVAKLILGLYEPREGRVLVDGRPIGDIDLRRFRSRVGVVPQAMFLFNDTVARNIAFDEPAMGRDAVVTAAELASVHSDIIAMPMGYETAIGEAGGNLSGGQRQRICLARALARQPRILLLDEATSELDVVSERAIQATLGSLSLTRIVIAHRISTVRSADVILVFEHGEIIERGTHDELMAYRGLYSEMVAGPKETGVVLAR